MKNKELKRRNFLSGMAAASAVAAAEAAAQAAPQAGSAPAAPSAPTNTKQADLDKARFENTPLLTTNQGGVIADNRNSLKAGPRGGTLLEDFILREKITHFDHERIPERVVHARGAGAHGYFQSYKSLSQFTRARFLNDTSIQTPVFVRFSTVGGSRGSADTVRDVRGFATKFYTPEGVFDIVGNNMPVFFIQDAIKFPDFVHSVKPEQNNEIPQASSAHDTFWDFISQETEATHMVMWLMSPRAIPRSLSTMEGFGVNTFRFVNEQGRSQFIKWHWKPVLGTYSMVWDEAQKLMGKDADFHRRELWESIERKEYPEFELAVQMIDEKDEMKFDFDILDATKLWPEEIVPVTRIGKMVLNRNPDNYFAETEQVAFCPTHLVPGIDFSNDPLLQGRLFSYLDTQISRIGPNFAQLPINRPIVPVSNGQREGKMQMMIPKGPVAYEPATIKGCPMHSPDALKGFVSYHEKIDAHEVRARSDSFKDHFSQAALFWNSQTAPEKKQIVQAFVFELTKVKDRDIRKRAIEQFARVDAALGAGIAQGLGEAPPTARPSNLRGAKSSAALSVIANAKRGSLKTRKVAILATNGVDDSSLSAVQKAITDAGATPVIVAERPPSIKTSSGRQVEVQMTLLTTASIMFDGVYVPGGADSVNALVQNGDAVHFLQEAFKHYKTVGANNEGLKLLPRGALEPKPSPGVAQTPNDFVAALGQHRHWDRSVDAIPA